MPAAQKPASPELAAAAALELVAMHIEQLAKIGDALAQSRLKQDVIILILQQITKVKREDIRYILNALPELKRYALKPTIPPKPKG